MIASESRDGIAVVSLDRPDRRNALVPALLQALVEALRRAAASGRPVILTGSGPAFCVGMVRARELLLTNRRLSAREAFEWGLVNAVAPAEELLDRAVAFAAGLAPVPDYALLQTRRLLNAGNLRNQLQMESVAIRTAARSEFFRKALERYRDTVSS